MLRTLLALPIKLYQKLISPIKPPTCRFHPSCSDYALQALRTHGAVRGSVLSTWRLLRCQPFARSGEDPVPQPPRKWPAPIDAAEFDAAEIKAAGTKAAEIQVAEINAAEIQAAD